MNSKILGWALLLGICSLFLFLMTQEINLTAVDLGRHLANGRAVVSALFDGKSGGSWNVLLKNFYSYTYPDFPFVNHHWGTGVVFYFIESFLGFEGLSLCFSLLNLLTLLIFCHLTYQIFRRRMESGEALLATGMIALLVLPLCAARSEIRPEGFSTFLLGVFYWVLLEWKWGRRGSSALWILPVLMVLWVNLHIYFFLGFFLLGVFLLEELSLGALLPLSVRVRTLLKIIVGCGAASLINPIGSKLAVFPFQIFKNYGYKIAENQSVFFFLKRQDVPIPELISFLIVFTILFFLIARLAFRGRLGGARFAESVLAAFFALMGFTAIRNMSMAGFFALPGIAALGAETGFLHVEGKRRTKFFTFLGGLGVVSLTLFLLRCGEAKWFNFGVGLMPGVSGAGEFLQNVPIQGPIFNNYDIGSYLDYYLFPNTRVFVDNRPEAYPKEFFTQLYVPMQENDVVWRTQVEKMGINAIVFYWRDLTPWGQSFLIARSKDPMWVPVYRDAYSLIFVKNVEQNGEIIRHYHL